MKKFNKNNVSKNGNAEKKLKNKLSNLEIKPQFLIIGLIAIITIISLIYFIFLKYSPIMKFKYDGYAISGKEITENLLGSGNNNDRGEGESQNNKEDNSQNSENSGSISNEDKNIDLAKIEEQGTIFKKLGQYFIGNKEKTEIDLNYPIYINDKNTIYNLNQDIALISKNFEQVAGYPNISITDGKVYNGNSLERADSKEYIFAKTEEGIYINLKEIKIKTTANEYVLPVNSLIVFEENSIRYYFVSNNILVFNEINDVDYNSQVTIKNVESDAVDTNAQNIQNEQNKENTNKVDKEYNYEELLTRLGVIENAKDTVEKEEIIEEDTSDDKKENNTESEPEPNAPQDQKPENNEQTNAEYIKPEVTVEDFKAEVYTAKSNLTIKDPKARIIEAPTFEIYKDGKIYLRRVFKNSGEIQITGLVPETEYEIIGKYIYLNAENKKVENTFYKGTIKTKGYEALGTIELSKEKGEIYSNKIQIKNVKIISDLQNEAIKGINQIELETGNIKTVLKNNKVNELLEGKEVTIESSEGLKSNTKIEYAIKFYDKNGKELKVENNKGTTRTSKQEPKVTVKIKEQDIVSVTLGVKLTNKDSVKLENYKYIITRPNGEKLKEERLSEHEKEIKLEDLDQNQYYKIKVYADYDLGDNKGIQKDVEIGNLVFATKPISTLGSLEMIVENKELTSKNAKISYKIDEDKTDKRLIQILNELTIKIVENNDDNKEISKPSAEKQNSEKESQHTNRKTTKEGTVIYTNTLTKEEIERLQLGEIKEINYENLKSNTKYTIEITGNVQLGNTQENIQVTYNYKEFTTLKIPAKVEIKNQFVTGNLIDLDVRVEDENNAVLNNTVRMELRNSSNDLIDLQELTTNEDFIRKTYEKLEENKTYKLSFYADQYNEGSTDETYKVNYLIKEIEIVTEPGISGSVGLTELTKKATGKNLVDMSSEIKWTEANFNTWGEYGYKYEKENNVIKIYSNSQHKRRKILTYDLTPYKDEKVTISFQAKISDISSDFTAYIVNSSSGHRNKELKDLRKDIWTTYTFTISNDMDGYIGFETNSNNDTYKELCIKDLQIELGDKKTNYEEFKYEMIGNVIINLEDKRDEIYTDNYYIRIFENDKLLINEENKLNEGNLIERLLKNYKLKENCDYVIKLVVEVNGREYVLDNYEFNTKDSKEIKGISTIAEYLKIQSRGTYIVLNDLELIGRDLEFRFGTDNVMFNGKIDFNGHKIKVHTKEHNNDQPLFYKIGKEGIIKNLVLDYYIDNTKFHSITGIAGNNYGKIENIYVNLKECPDTARDNIRLIAIANYGCINKFVIKAEKSLKGSTYLALGVSANYGIIKNGYVYGENIKANYDIGNRDRVIGGLILKNYSGLVENVYSLINIEVSGTSAMDYMGNIIAYNYSGAKVKNIYSIGYGNQQEFRYGPTVFWIENQTNIENIYYFADKIFNNTENQKLTPLALWDNNFQNNVLNKENTFNVNELVNNGYYPMVNMPDCMPKQEYIKLPPVEDKDLPDILNSEILEQSHNYAKIKITVNNPSAETITSIKMKYINSKIESQEYSNGKSEVIVMLENPTIYISKYCITEISTKGTYGKEYTRKFKENERIVKVEFYKEIHSIEDWKNIKKSPTENYILMEDLDFKNEGNKIIISNTLTGKIDGNNHTIKNIIINNVAYLINVLKGELKNLNILNCQITYKGSTSLIYSVEGKIKNCNIQTMKLNSSDSKDETLQGAFTSRLTGNMENCTATDIEIINNNTYSIHIGGLAGFIAKSEIKNCFVTGLKVNIEEGNVYVGIGGVVGYESDVSKITNCIAEGSINADGDNIGGIAGKIKVSSNIENSISKVNITGSSDVLGGIVGIKEDTVSSVINNLSLGNLYSSKNGIQGKSIIHSGTDNINNNYYYEGQKINGISVGKKDYGSLSYNELKDLNTYTQKIRLDDNYNYDKIKEGILPKLMDTNKNEILSNQQDIYIDEYSEISVISIKTEKNTVSSIEGQILLNNPKGLEITNININFMDTVIKNINSKEGVTYIYFNANPNKYFDTYKLDTIYYKENNHKKEIKIEVKIEQEFYKEIYNCEDWQGIDNETYQNYRLMNDLDFTGRNNIKTNVSIGKLEGTTDGKIKTIKNISLELNGEEEALIKQIKYNLENIRFENIFINNTANNQSYCNLINTNNGSISNTEFNNITINANNMNYVGIIGENYGYINNIKVLGTKVTGINRVAGLVCNSKNAKGIENIIAEKITVTATGNEVGGIVGNVYRHLCYNIQIKDSTIKANNYIGGIFGVAQGKGDVENIRNISANNIEVTGNSNVGGITGQTRDYGMQFANIYNSEIYGTGENIGGAIGQKSDWAHVKSVSVKECNIEGIGIASRNVGGAIGNDASNYITNIYVCNTTIKSTGNDVGGLIGRKSYHSQVELSVGYNLSVSGSGDVGGLIGSGNAKIQKCYINANVKASINAAGGLIGNLKNIEMNDINNTSELKESYFVGTVIGEKNVGGQIGNIEEDIYIGKNNYYYYSNYVQADLICNDNATISLGIGSNKNQNEKIKDSYYYKYSTINGENPNLQNEMFIKLEQYLDETDLNKKESYIEKLKWGNYWNYWVLNDNKYPILNNTNLPEQKGIPLPKDAEHIVTNAKLNIEDELKQEDDLVQIEIPKCTFKYDGKDIKTYNTFSEIISEDGSKVVRNDIRLYVKNGRIHALPVEISLGNYAIKLVESNFIIDSYNGKEYETVLGEDGKLYDIKESIAYPENFVNEGIESIGNNLKNDSHELEVTYKNGNSIKFNYQTGEIISSIDEKSENKDIFEYIKEKTTEIRKSLSRNSNNNDMQNKYLDSQVLKNKLEEIPVEEALQEELKRNDNNINNSNNNENDQANNSLKETRYISIYNAEKGDYQIYQEEELLDTSKQEVISENEKIEANNLKAYYASEGKSNNTKMGIVWITLSIIGVVIILFAIKKRD